MIEAARAVDGTTAWVSAGAENRMLAKKTYSSSENCQKRSIHFHLCPNQIASEQDLHPREMTSALAHAEVISRSDTQSVS